MSLACVAWGVFVIARASYRLYVQMLRVEASTLMRAPAVLQGHLDRIDRSMIELDELLLRMRRALHSIDESTRSFRKTGRVIATAVTATKMLFGVVSSPWKRLGS